MKAKVERGSGFRGVLDYAIDNEKTATIVGGNMTGTTPRELASEFGISRKIRPGCAKPVLHVSLALPVGEDLDPSKWAEVTDAFMAQMGLDKHQYIAIKHEDKPHKHVHIIASRIALDGSLWHGKWEVFRAIEATQLLEKQFGLTLTPGLDSIDAEDHKKNVTKNEMEQSVRTGEAPARQLLQNIIDDAVQGNPSVTAFVERLEAAGVTVKPNVATTGKLNGFGFSINGIPFKGSDLGKKYAWKGLQQQGVTYDQDRESGALISRKGETFGAEGANRSPDTAADRGLVQEPDGAVRTERDNVQGPAQSHDEIGGLSRPVDQRIDEEGGIERERPSSSSSPDAGVEQAQPVHDIDSDQLDRLRTWSRVADTAAALAAPVNPGSMVSVPEPVSKALQKKQEAWERQAGALGAPTYRITLKGRKEGLPTYIYGKKDGNERFYTQDEVTTALPRLSRENARGFDVYVTPIDPGHHYVLVDDMRADQMKEVMAAYEPCIVQESSHDNYQAVIKLPRGAISNEQPHANKVVVELNKQYGDPNLSGVIRPFRMAGFSNKKEGRNDAFTRVLHAVNRICSKATGMLKAIIEKAQEASKDMGERFDRERQILVAGTATGAPRSTVDAYRREYAMQVGLARKNAWSEDESRYDWYATIGLLKAGHDPASVKQALLVASPHVTDRKHDPDDYAQRTVEKALAEEDVQKAIQANNRPSLFDAVKQEEKQSVEKGRSSQKSDDLGYH